MKVELKLKDELTWTKSKVLLSTYVADAGPCVILIIRDFNIRTPDMYEIWVAKTERSERFHLGDDGKSFKTIKEAKIHCERIYSMFVAIFG